MNRWNRFKITGGQLARFSIATNQVARDMLYLPGYFFEVAAKPLVFKLYTSHFSMLRTDAAATNRSNHFRLICEAAMDLYREHDKHPNDLRKNADFERKTAKSIREVWKLRNDSQRRSRAATRETKQSSNRIAEGQFLTENDFVRLQGEVCKCLGSFLDTYQVKAQINSALDCPSSIALAKVLSQINHRLLKKWCLSSKIMFLVYGNGQRSQVYTG